MSSEDGLNLYLLLLVFGVVPFVLWVMSLVSALRYTEQRWQSTGQNRLVYVLLIVFLGLLGSLLYLLIARPKLKVVAHGLPAGGASAAAGPPVGAATVALSKGGTRSAPAGEPPTGRIPSRPAAWLSVVTSGLLLGGLVVLFGLGLGQYNPATVNMLVLAEGVLTGAAGVLALRGRAVPMVALLWGALVLDLPWRLLIADLWPWNLNLPWSMSGGSGVPIYGDGGMVGFGYWLWAVAFVTLVCAVVVATVSAVRRPKVSVAGVASTGSL